MTWPHLSRERMLALIESPSESEETHLGRCDTCRREIQALRAVLREVTELETPEPSPLYWEALSERIRDAVARERRGAVPPVAWGPWVSWAGGLGVAVVLALVLVGPFPDLGAPERLQAVPDEPGVADADQEWQLLLTIVDGGGEPIGDEWLDARPGVMEGLVADLTGEERATLIELLGRESGGS